MLRPRVVLMRSGSAMLLAALVALPCAAQDYCRPFPPGSTFMTSELDEADRRAGWVAKCTAGYPKGQISLIVFNSPEVPAQEVARTPATDPAATARPIAGLGDSSVELSKEQTPPGNADSPVRYNITFARGCTNVLVSVGGYIMDESGVAEWNASRDWVRATASSIDEFLKSVPPCPGSTTTTTDPPIVPPGGLGVIASCQVINDSTGDAGCTATPTDARPDANLTYSWTFDGAAQSATGSELPLPGVSFGDHTVTVVANDTTNQLTSSPQTVTFSRRSSSEGGSGVGGGGSGGGGGGGSRIPIGPIVITIIAATGIGGIGWVITRKGGKPSPFAPGSEPLGSPPRPRPPAVLPERPGAKSPAEATPKTPPVSHRPPPPEKLKPPVAPPPIRRPAPPETFKPPAVVAADGRDQRDSDVWLEADLTSVRVLGDGKSEVVVTVIARSRSGALTLDASNEVTPSRTTSDPKRVLLTGKAGYCTFAVRGRHAGNVPANATITITGVSSLGRRVRPATIAVTIDPLSIEVRITVAKDGFVETNYVTTLPEACRSVHGRVDGGVVRARDGEPDRQPVGFARCEASLRMAHGNWSEPVRVRTEKDGSFWFGLPSRIVQLYQATAEYQIPKAIELAWTKEVLDAMTGYGNEWLTFRHNLENMPGGNDYAALDEPLDRYRDTFASQLRDREEDDFPTALAGIHLLRANLAFATKYRNDVVAQRRIVDLTAQEFLSSAFDVFTDFVDLAAIVFGWIKVGGSLMRSGATDGLVGLIDRLGTLPGSGIASRALLVVLRTLRVPVETFETAVEGLIARAADLAGETGLPLYYIRKIHSIGDDARELAEGELWKVTKNTFREAWDVFMIMVQRILFGGMKVALALMHIVILVLCAAGKVMVTLMRQLPWGEDSTWVGSLMERVEYEMGELIGEIYENFGLIMDKLCGRFYFNKAVGNPPSALSEKSLADIVLDAVTTLADLDRKSAVEMKRAYEKALALDVYTNWQLAIREVSDEEKRVMLVMEAREKLFYDVGFVADVIKLAMKVLQAIVFTWTVASVGVLKLLRWGVGKLGDAGRAFAGTIGILSKTTEEMALGFHKKLERLVDLCDLIAVRAPILMMEVGALYLMTEMGPSRMRALLEKGWRT